MVQCAHPTSFEFHAPAHRPRFEIHAERCPQALSRVLDQFVRRGVIPADIRARTSCAGLWIAIEAETGSHIADRIVEKLRSTVGVTSVIVIDIAPSQEPANSVIRRASRLETAMAA